MKPISMWSQYHEFTVTTGILLEKKREYERGKKPCP